MSLYNSPSTLYVKRDINVGDPVMLFCPNDTVVIDANIVSSSKKIAIVANRIIFRTRCIISCTHPKGKLQLRVAEILGNQVTLACKSGKIGTLSKVPAQWKSGRHLSANLKGKIQLEGSPLISWIATGPGDHI